MSRLSLTLSDWSVHDCKYKEQERGGSRTVFSLRRTLCECMRGSSRGTPHSRHPQPWQGICIAYLYPYEMCFIHLVMNSACGQLRFRECSPQSMIMHSKHLDSFTEDTVMVEGTVCRTWVVAMTIIQYMLYVKYVKSSYRQQIGTAVKMEDGGGQLQVCYSSLRDCTKIIEGGEKRGRLCIFCFCWKEGLFTFSHPWFIVYSILLLWDSLYN